MNLADHEEMILKIIEVKEHGFFVESAFGVAKPFIIESFPTEDLQAGQLFDHPFINLDQIVGKIIALLDQKAVQRCRAQILLEIDLCIEVLRINFRDGQSFRVEMAGEPQEGSTFPVVGAIGTYCAVCFALKAIIHPVGTGGSKRQDKAGIFPGPGFKEVGECRLYFRWIHNLKDKLGK